MAVPAVYRFQIAAAYTLNAADTAEIAADKAANITWGKGYWGFRENIRRYLKLAQNGRCAFCRCRVSVGTSWSNLEHMVGKDDYEQFEFTPENLVYSCTRCNMSKVKRNTLSNANANKALQVFPINSAGFTIVNPYHDPYEHHVDFVDDVIIVNISPKGLETISLYKLYRPELAEERAREFNLNQQTVTQQLMARMTDTTQTQATLDQINAVISQLPIWTL
jgi:uncharacterized protein (TIGR02646 family)